MEKNRDLSNVGGGDCVPGTGCRDQQMQLRNRNPSSHLFFLVSLTVFDEAFLHWFLTPKILSEEYFEDFGSNIIIKILEDLCEIWKT